jgi:hypothetical protein
VYLEGVLRGYGGISVEKRTHSLNV